MKKDFDKENAQSKTTYKDIPDYQSCDEKTRAAYDEIIDAHDIYDTEQMSSYGDSLLDKQREVTDRILTAMTNEENGVFREPMRECLDDLKNLNLEQMLEHVDRVVQGGAKFAKNNKGSTVLALAGVVTGQFWLTLASGGYAAGKEYLKKHGVALEETMQQRRLVRKDDSNSVEAVSERLQKAVTTAKGHIRKLEFADKQTPKLLERINEMAMANRDVYNGATLLIGAGHEMVRRIREEALPAAREECAQNHSLDAQMKVDLLTENLEILDHKIQILEQSRTSAVLSTQNLADMKSAIVQNRHSLQSLLTSEVSQWSRTVAIAGLALDTFRTTNTVEDFRNYIDSVQDDSIRAAQYAIAAAAKGQIGNPERLEKIIEQTITFREGLKTRHDALDKMAALRDGQRKRLLEETTKLVAAQAEYAEKEMNRRLEGPQDAQQKALPDLEADSGTGQGDKPAPVAKKDDLNKPKI